MMSHGAFMRYRHLLEAVRRYEMTESEFREKLLAVLERIAKAIEPLPPTGSRSAVQRSRASKGGR